MDDGSVLGAFVRSLVLARVCVQDMAGLLKPRSAPLLVEAIRSVTDLPIHFHTHATSSCSLATALEMARAGCDVIDFATASMADCTSQPR